MRAAHITQYGDPEEALEIVDVERPEPGAGEVRVDVKAVALNHLDVFARKGTPKTKVSSPSEAAVTSPVSWVPSATASTPTASVTRWSSTPASPVVTVSSASAASRRCATSTKLSAKTVPEGWPSRLSSQRAVSVAKPESLDDVTAAAVPITFTTAWRMVVGAGELRPAETALILGASGGVGNAALQIAERLGATTYATTSTAEKAERVREWADEVIDYTETPHDEAVMDLTDGRGVDLVAEHVGQETWQESINSLAMGGRMVVCGATSGADPDIDIRSIYQRHRQIRGAPMGNRAQFRDVLSLVARGELEPQIDRVLPSNRSRRVTGRLRIGPCSEKSYCGPDWIHR